MMRENYRGGKYTLGIVGMGFVALLFLLWGKLQLGQLRYFDADELAYLHWAHNVFDGKLPYKDFLSYVPPLYYYVVSLLFWGTTGVAILSTARVFAFAVFVLLCWGLALLFSGARNRAYAIFAAVFLAVLPMPADKFIEVRPDNLAMLVALFALLIHGTALTVSGNRMRWAAAGLLYGISFFILPKTVPQILLAGIVTVLWRFFSPYPVKEKNRHILAFIGGGMLPFIWFGLWIPLRMGIGGYDTVLYSLLKLPLEVNRLGVQFPLQPDLFFYPNTVLYGQEGWGTSLILTHLLWLIGIFTAAVRLVTPFLPGGKKGVFRELLIAGSFFIYTVTFIYGYPMRHSQYLIPIAVFIAFYNADVMALVFTRLVPTRWGRAVGVFLLGVLLVGAVSITARTTEAKMRYSNAEDYTILSYALRTIPSGAYVFDLVGSTIYFRDPFYVSAVPFGQWMPYVSRPMGSVVEALQRTDTRYIYEGRLARLDGFPGATAHSIRQQFSPVSGVAGMHVRRE